MEDFDGMTARIYLISVWRKVVNSYVNYPIISKMNKHWRMFSLCVQSVHSLYIHLKVAFSQVYNKSPFSNLYVLIAGLHASSTVRNEGNQLTLALRVGQSYRCCVHCVCSPLLTAPVALCRGWVLTVPVTLCCGWVLTAPVTLCRGWVLTVPVTLCCGWVLTAPVTLCRGWVLTAPVTLCRGWVLTVPVTLCRQGWDPQERRADVLREASARMSRRRRPGGPRLRRAALEIPAAAHQAERGVCVCSTANSSIQ